MDVEELKHTLTPLIKTVRTEFNYNQNQMAELLGISKKTLVQYEKGRKTATWPTIVVLTSLFRDSVYIQRKLGEDDVVHYIQILARKNVVANTGHQTKSRWAKIDEQNGYILQKNTITKYYRVIDQFGNRIFSSFYKTSVLRHFQQIIKKDD
ncbi:helix-turn-helix domain-containing protein [Aquisalibacillus elongatus]|uniref:DNA-binding XRE family transcriptional regulator n=1 Tax=Aquisalibacillus elongatus TaxID=485577 RepID=A0A3N5CER4_9BACI|nr:helix-turn-helix transcriptional regulator [Aquisalibacillus elongatus]RPF55741.1 DNA-binding XRE family transcriptional regulator [Aquisalibacillus elongatus]